VRLTGQDGPHEFPVTGGEAGKALRSFVKNRLPAFGPQQDAMLATDPFMAHSLLSAALNLGRLDPVERARAAEAAYRAGDAWRASSGSSSAGGTTCGTCTGTSGRSTGTAARCRTGSPGWTRTRSGPAA
jgi:hypothetical protein